MHRDPITKKITAFDVAGFGFHSNVRKTSIFSDSRQLFAKSISVAVLFPPPCPVLRSTLAPSIKRTMICSLARNSSLNRHFVDNSALMMENFNEYMTTPEHDMGWC